jgi:hypothetical protein
MNSVETVPANFEGDSRNYQITRPELEVYNHRDVYPTYVYRAQATDEKGNEYTVTWELVDPIYGCPTPDEIAAWEDTHGQSIDALDEDDACDWDNPISISWDR